MLIKPFEIPLEALAPVLQPRHVYGLHLALEMLIAMFDFLEYDVEDGLQLSLLLPGTVSSQQAHRPHFLPQLLTIELSKSCLLVAQVLRLLLPQLDEQGRLLWCQITLLHFRKLLQY